MGKHLVQDLRFALRSLRTNWTFTAAAVALALGLGANTAIFSVVDAVMFRPLPYPESQRLVVTWTTRRNIDYKSFENPAAVRAMRHWSVADDDLAVWTQRTRTLDALSGWRTWEVTVSGAGDPERLRGAAVTPEFFRLFGARTVLGRTFLPTEDRPGDDQVIVLSHGMWQRRFGSDPRVLGRTINIDGVPHAVVGVVEPGFRPVLPSLIANPEYYITMSHAMQGARRKFAIFTAAGRLRPGVTLAQAQADMTAMAAGIEKENPRKKDQGIELVPLEREVSEGARPSMIVLLGAVGCVLLICCANVANLLLTRATARQREISVRAVLGAGQWRLVRQLLTESVLLAGLGGVAGMLLAHWGVRALVAAMPTGTLPRTAEMTVDLRVFLFGFGLSLVTGLLFGIVPAVEAARWSMRGLSEAIKEGGRAGAGGRGRRLRNTLVVAEVALALVLLTSAGLLVRSFVSLRGVDLGFRAEHVLTAGLTLPTARYPDMPQRAAFIERVLERVEHVPGVTVAAMSNSVPVSPRSVVSVNGLEIEGVTDNAAAGYRTVTPDYFRVMGVPLRKGRLFTPADMKGSTIIVNEAFVRRYWPGLRSDSPEPLGRHITWKKTAREIIAVVGDIKFHGIKADPTPEIYMPYTENMFPYLALMVTTTRPAGQITPPVRAAVHSVDRDLALERVATMDDVIGEELAQPRFHMTLLVSFAVLALALAAVGIYGVVGYSVTQRSREIGIRMALGASPGSVLRSVLGEAALLALGGVAGGVAAALGATRALSSFLFGVKPVDPPTIAAVAGVLIAVALAAAWLPARRALRVDPMVALRYE
jgi:putative ABC transport system permease protein